jgi:hypothetical protein
MFVKMAESVRSRLSGHARFVCDRVSVISSVHQPTTGNSVTAVEAAEIIDVRFVGTRG